MGKVIFVVLGKTNAMRETNTMHVEYCICYVNTVL